MVSVHGSWLLVCVLQLWIKLQALNKRCTKLAAILPCTLPVLVAPVQQSFLWLVEHGAEQGEGGSVMGLWVPAF